jgi:hypothetical protein
MHGDKQYCGVIFDGGQLWRRRGDQSRSAMYGCLSLFLLALFLLAFGTLSRFKMASSAMTAAKENIVRSNMRAVQLAVESYAAEGAGTYPAAIGGPADRERGIDSTDARCCSLRGLRNPFDPRIPAVITRYADPPAWDGVDPGQVVYVPLLTDSTAVRDYRIYGMGSSRPLQQLLDGRH